MVSTYYYPCFTNEDLMILIPYFLVSATDQIQGLLFPVGS